MADQNAREINDRQGAYPHRNHQTNPAEECSTRDTTRHGKHDGLNDAFQRHINLLETDMLETGQFTFGPPPLPPFFAARPLSDRLGGRTDSRESSRNTRSRQLGATPMEGDEAESYTLRSSVVSSVVVVDNKETERPGEASKARYLERVKDLRPG